MACKRGRALVGSVDKPYISLHFRRFFTFYNFLVVLTDSCVNPKLTDGKYKYKNEASSVYVHGFVLLKYCYTCLEWTIMYSFLAFVVCSSYILRNLRNSARSLRKYHKIKTSRIANKCHD
jgi:hypothetical protein